MQLREQKKLNRKNGTTEGSEPEADISDTWRGISMQTMLCYSLPLNYNIQDRFLSTYFPQEQCLTAIYCSLMKSQRSGIEVVRRAAINLWMVELSDQIKQTLEDSRIITLSWIQSHFMSQVTKSHSYLKDAPWPVSNDFLILTENQPWQNSLTVTAENTDKHRLSWTFSWKIISQMW